MSPLTSTLARGDPFPARGPVAHNDPMKIQLVVFDVSGTTVRDDDAVNTCMQEALGGFVRVTRADVNPLMGLPKETAIRKLLELKLSPAQTVSQKLVARVHEDFLARMLRFYRTAPCVEPMPHAMETFGRLKEAGLRLALGTGFNRLIVDAILERLGWNRGALFDATVASDEVPRGRPHADLLLKAMELTGTADARTVAKVGDTPSDLQEGMAAGCGLVIGVTHGYHSREELASHPHTHLISDLQDLPGIVLGEPLSGPARNGPPAKPFSP
jgi:phosphonatase-like hydrolase